MNQESPLFRKASAEVLDFHRFFEAWYDAATADNTDFGRCERTFGHAFHMIPPTGRIFDRAGTIELIRANRATFHNDFSIEISDIRASFETEDTIVLTYVEAQSRGGKYSRRQASALFIASSSAPNGVEWRHLHETWLQMPEN
ncbi:hypothetical protein HGP16_12350 [Rhizobium sp. P40RR-XXII]|uniref:hypothetical protein n=1 Tax=unclassified Rhizobium TaxID=2613769 RepID=UPI001457278B|nr:MULTISPECIES: hypothetical protein [unclassified Rhizobium]NLR86678.1 hypothetical protein [Rhizobium sp. P28RR-XV]NLS17350.1 hypothetical protein [Rhizobium sp. P40RR-XXII]